MNCPLCRQPLPVTADCGPTHMPCSNPDCIWLPIDRHRYQRLLEAIRAMREYDYDFAYHSGFSDATCELKPGSTPNPHTKS